MKKHGTGHPPVLFDKHIDETTLSVLFSGATRTAKSARPQSIYEGDHPNDEDFAEVLQVAWEDYATIVTADGAFFEKTQQFQGELKKRKKDRCFRGVLLLPKQRDEQVRLLTAFLDGSLTVRLQGLSEVVTVSDVHENNLGIDFRDKVPVAIELCKCKRKD